MGAGSAGARQSSSKDEPALWASPLERLEVASSWKAPFETDAASA
jgi:hypothetical protein